MMRTVLCYGDSNTWGTAVVPRPDGRYAPDGYAAAFALLGLLQFAAIAWLLPMRLRQ